MSGVGWFEGPWGYMGMIRRFLFRKWFDELLFKLRRSQSELFEKKLGGSSCVCPLRATGDWSYLTWQFLNFMVSFTTSRGHPCF